MNGPKVDKNVDNIGFFGHNEDKFFRSLQFTLMNPLLSLAKKN